MGGGACVRRCGFAPAHPGRGDLVRCRTWVTSFKTTLARVPDGFDLPEPLRLLFAWVDEQGFRGERARRGSVRLVE